MNDGYPARRIGRTVFTWMKSYLFVRSQAVSIGDVFSEAAALHFGVPQGSLLGPILFIICTLPTGIIARLHYLRVHVYAYIIKIRLKFSHSHRNCGVSVIEQ